MKRAITLFMCLGILCNVFAQMPPQETIPEVKNIVNSRNTLDTNSGSSVALVGNPNFECGYNYYWDVNFTGVTEGTFTDATADALSGKINSKKNTVCQSITLNRKLFDSDTTKNTIVLSYGGHLFELSLDASELNSKLFFPVPTISLTKDDPMVSSDIITD
jgi:hypothetical protein